MVDFICRENGGKMNSSHPDEKIKKKKKEKKRKEKGKEM